MKTTLTLIAAAGLSTGAMAGEPVELTAPGPEGDLSGTLIAPAEGESLVLIVPGSGPTDRDGNSPMGITSASYRLLAEALAEKGIGSLRIDKRGMFGSKAAIPDANDVTIAAYAADVQAWAKVARAETGAECVWILGHSEGGLVALEAVQDDQGICGVLLVASVGRPFGTILREQLKANPANAIILEQAFSAIDRLETGERVNTTNLHPGLQGLFNRDVQGFLIDAMSRDPAKLAENAKVPMLVVAGGKDIQTSVTDAKVLAEVRPDAMLVVIDDMNHVLKAVEGDTRAANLAAYSDSSLPIHPDLVDAVAAFVSAPDD